MASDTVPLPVESANWKLSVAMILASPEGTVYLKQFASRTNQRDFFFWLTVEEFRGVADEKVDALAQRIWEMYFEDSGDGPAVDLDSDILTKLQERFTNGEVDRFLFNDAQRFILSKHLMPDTLTDFFQSPEYKELLQKLWESFTANYSKNSRKKRPSLSKVMNNALAIHIFRMYLDQPSIKMAHVLDFVLSVISFKTRRLSNEEKATDAGYLKSRFLNPNSKDCINQLHKDKRYNAVKIALERSKGNISSALFDLSLKHAWQKLSKQCLPGFYASKLWLTLTGREGAGTKLGLSTSRRAHTMKPKKQKHRRSKSVPRHHSLDRATSKKLSYKRASKEELLKLLTPQLTKRKVNKSKLPDRITIGAGRSKSASRIDRSKSASSISSTASKKKRRNKFSRVSSKVALAWKGSMKKKKRKKKKKQTKQSEGASEIESIEQGATGSEANKPEAAEAPEAEEDADENDESDDSSQQESTDFNALPPIEPLPDDLDFKHASEDEDDGWGAYVTPGGPDESMESFKDLLDEGDGAKRTDNRVLSQDSATTSTSMPDISQVPPHFDFRDVKENPDILPSPRELWKDLERLGISKPEGQPEPT